jgi:hypothetical protein|tara:strand:+ start:1464 stop:1745 length:282 start_codon:yes stop_codon:yes gene_type:complete
VAKPGSLKWFGQLKWGYYINLFLRLAAGESYAFSALPYAGGYLENWARDPRLMAILETVQTRMRMKAAEKRQADADRLRNKSINLKGPKRAKR